MLKKTIQTRVDPAYVYPFRKTKYAPKDDKCLLLMGQTEERINEYLKYFPDKPLPGGWAAYWGITEFKGVVESFKNETGSSQYHQWLVDAFPNTVIQSALWMVGTNGIAKHTADGKYDDNILKFADWAKSINRPLYLRIGYEFDGIHNELDPKTYVAAYRRVVALLREKNVNNIAYVWHSYASKPFNDHQMMEWYPGDDFVDWTGISVFGHAYDDTDFGEYCNELLAIAKQRGKPVMIAECNPIKGIVAEDPSAWEDWFVNFFSFVYQKNIKAISFINEDWQSLTIPGISEWQDGKLWNNTKVAEAWFQETHKTKYLKQSSALFEELGYSAND